MIHLVARFVAVVLAPLALAISAPSCATNTRTDVRPPLPDQHATGFKNVDDLLATMVDGRFDTQPQLESELAKLTVPKPVEIDFTHGADLDPSQANAIQGIVDNLESDFQLRVDVIGCSDRTGWPEESLHVSRDRAKAVADQLHARGAPPWQIGDVVGRGESCDKKARMAEVRYQLMDVPQSQS